MADNNPNSVDQNHVFDEVVPNESSDQAVFTNPITDPNAPSEQSDDQMYEQDAYYESSDFYVGEPQVQVTENKDRKQLLDNDTIKKITDFIIAKWWMILGVAALIAITIIIAASVFNRETSQFNTTDFLDVSARIEGPSTSPSSAPAIWKVFIENNNSDNIENVQVSLNFDRSFQYINPITPEPSIPAGNEYQFNRITNQTSTIIQFEGVLVGNIDEETAMTGSITYTPAPIRDEQQNTRTIEIESVKTKITSPLVDVTMLPTQQVVENGGEAQLNITFNNRSERDINDLQIELDYPDGNAFDLQSSQLQLTNSSDIKTQPDNGQNIWLIPTLPRLQEQTLTLNGILNGEEGVQKVFRVNIGVRGENNQFQTIASTTTDITVKAQPLVLRTFIEGNDGTGTFEPGERLKFVIEYENRGTTVLNDVELFSLIDDPANILDYSTLSFIGGNRGNNANEVITWEGNGTPILARVTPSVRGSVEFQIKVKEQEQFIQTSLNQSSYTLRPRARAQATNLELFEVAGDQYKGQGDLMFEQTIGEPQPVEGQANAATVEVTWRLTSVQNQVIDPSVIATSSLPDNAFLVGSITPETSKDQITYNPTNGQIEWKPGTVPSYAGLSNPAPTVSFTFRIESETNSFRGITLFGKSNITGVDDFTGERYERIGDDGQTR